MCSRRWCCCCWDARRHTDAAVERSAAHVNRERTEKSRDDDGDDDDCDSCGAQQLKNEILVMRIYWSRCCWTLFFQWERASEWVSGWGELQKPIKMYMHCTRRLFTLLFNVAAVQRPLYAHSSSPFVSYPFRCVFYSNGFECQIRRKREIRKSGRDEYVL